MTRGFNCYIDGIALVVWVEVNYVAGGIFVIGLLLEGKENIILTSRRRGTLCYVYSGSDS